jgi:hypothetical protein
VNAVAKHTTAIVKLSFIKICSPYLKFGLNSGGYPLFRLSQSQVLDADLRHCWQDTRRSPPDSIASIS